MKSPVTKKVGLFGGTFDPIHKTHIDIALEAIKQLQLSEVWFLPEKSPRYKTPPTTIEHRLKMLELACKDYCDLKIVNLPEPNHDLGTLKRITESNQATTFTIIAGMDLITYLDKWDNYPQFLNIVNFAVVARPGVNISLFEAMIRRLGEYSTDFDYQILNFKPSGVSSTDIRKSSMNHAYITQDVKDYISKNKLYS